MDRRSLDEQIADLRTLTVRIDKKLLADAKRCAAAEDEDGEPDLDWLVSVALEEAIRGLNDTRGER